VEVCGAGVSLWKTIRVSAAVRAWKHRRGVFGVLSGSFLILSLLGFSVSLWAHLETLAGIDPAARHRGIWIVQLVLLGLVLPILFEIFHCRNPFEILRSPRWMQVALYTLLAYYGLNFYVFLYWSVDHLTSCATWRMFSAGWLLLFGLAAVYYDLRFFALSDRDSLD